MNGFKIFVTNTTASPSDGYLCYEDPKSNTLPNITQTISCHQLGQYVVYYDNVGSEESDQIYLPIVELCYVAINGRFYICVICYSSSSPFLFYSILCDNMMLIVCQLNINQLKQRKKWLIVFSCLCCVLLFVFLFF